ncbi:PAP2 superfamily protein [Pseudomonas duriflava]|uniref:PAP2 superfamily protein n=1 Tax=Pseudomonas duriflava TaxID=459528 RepID=A0A562QF55_9PSED|nr:phosphatase PAP2 family protein [Pseudomonas duriflava]TWI54800.1 PAP2 superfamily protein [Pseudomonas duriflava]
MQGMVFITNFGDSSVMLPCALIIALWLWIGASRRAALLWLVLFGTACLSVAVSKMAFFGWGVGIRAYDFTGFSGHSMLACSVIPVLFWLLASRTRAAVRGGAALAGALFALVISATRIKLGFHSISEVVTGAPIGLVTSGSFLWLMRAQSVQLRSSLAVMASLVAPLLVLHGLNAPTQHLMEDLATKLSSGASPYTRAHQRAGVKPLSD